MREVFFARTVWLKENLMNLSGNVLFLFWCAGGKNRYALPAFF